MKNLKYIITSVLLLGTVASCDSLVGEPDLPIPLNETLSNTGAFLRVLEVTSAAIDIADPANAAYSFSGEVSDVDQGANAESVTFYVSYRSVDEATSGYTLSEVEVKTYNASSFTTNETSGLPGTTFSVSLTEMLDAFGSNLAVGDVSIGDRFDLRWDLTLKDGTVFTNEDMSAATTGGFYASPFFARVSVVVSLAEGDFVGSYNFTQRAASSDIAGAFANGWIWEGAQSFDADLSVNPDNTINGRVFTATPLAEYGVAAREYPLDFGLFLTLAGDVTSGLTCGGGIYYGIASENRGSFDPNDDSSFEMVIKENSLSDCGLAGEEIFFDVVKN